MRPSAHGIALAAVCATAAARGETTQKPIWLGEDRAGVRGSSPFTKEYEKHVGKLLEEWHVPGVAVGVVDGDKIWTEGFGIATFPSTPVTPSTLFYCASTSKAFTAAALSIMIESGNYTSPAVHGQKLAWDSRVGDLIPGDFVLADAWATAHVTLEDALSHRTGLPRHDKASAHRVLDLDLDLDGGTGEEGRKRNATVRDGVRFLRYLPLNAAPRTRWQYCNQMYVAASHVVQTLAGGRWLGDLLREWVWVPLGMRSTYFSLPDALAAPEHLAAGYAWDEARQNFSAVAYMPVDEIGGAGSVISNVGDYTRWVRSLLRGEGPLGNKGHAAVKTPRMIVSPPDQLPPSSPAGSPPPLPYDGPEMYALGWETSSYRGHRFWKHAGGMHAYGAEVFFFPDLDFGVVALGNTASTSNVVELLLVWELVDDRLGVPESERYDWHGRFAGMQDRAKERVEKAIDNYYPDRPEHPIPPSLPLKACTGTYFHPGYLNFTLELLAGEDDSSRPARRRARAALSATRRDATWPTYNEFEHVSGEYWMMFLHTLGQPAGVADGEYAPAQFRVGADGRADALGITFLSVEPAGDTVEGLVWFERVA